MEHGLGRIAVTAAAAGFVVLTGAIEAWAGGGLATPSRSPLTLERRVEAQRAIERVYWNHRIWPAVNPTPKPPFEEVLSGADLRARVEDVLAKSDALARIGASRSSRRICRAKRSGWPVRLGPRRPFGSCSPRWATIPS